MSDTNGQPDPDIRTEPLEESRLAGRAGDVGARDAADASATTSTPEQNKAADRVEDEERPRPSTDAETQEDTASGGPAD